MIDKRVLVIDDHDQTEIMEELKYDANKKGIVLYYEQFGVGGKLEPGLLTGGRIDMEKVIPEFKRRFCRKKFNLIACDWDLNDPEIDGVELLKRLSNTCQIKYTDRLLYSGLLNIKLHDKLEAHKEKKISEDAFISYLRELITSRFVDFVDRTKMPSSVLQYFSEVESIDHLLTKILLENPDLVFETTQDHNFKGKSFEKVADMIERDQMLMTELKRHIMHEVVIHLTRRYTKNNDKNNISD